MSEAYGWTENVKMIWFFQYFVYPVILLITHYFLVFFRDIHGNINRGRDGVRRKSDTWLICQAIAIVFRCLDDFNWF